MCVCVCVPMYSLYAEHVWYISCARLCVICSSNFNYCIKQQNCAQLTNQTSSTYDEYMSTTRMMCALFLYIRCMQIVLGSKLVGIIVVYFGSWSYYGNKHTKLRTTFAPTTIYIQRVYVNDVLIISVVPMYSLYAERVWFFFCVCVCYCFCVIEVTNL